MTAGALQGRRILVVEDEYFIAADLRRALDREGAVVIGPVGDLVSALRIVNEQPLDAAVLDVNLAGTVSYPVAEALSERGVPHMFLTGYDSWSMPERHRDAPRLSKPFAAAAVIATAGALCVGEKP